MVNADRSIQRMRRSILFELFCFSQQAGRGANPCVLLASLRCSGKAKEKHVFTAAIIQLLQQGLVIGVPQPGQQLAVCLNLSKRAEIDQELAWREWRANPGVLIASCFGIVAGAAVAARIVAQIWR